MISLLASRPSAERYPFYIDIESTEKPGAEHEAGTSPQNKLYQLAEISPLLAHALLMVSASHVALQHGNDVSNDQGAIHHKGLVLQLLNEAIKELQTANRLETLASIAILASFEVWRIKSPAIDMGREH